MAITKIDAATETFDGFARVILFPMSTRQILPTRQPSPKC